ncbi:MAG: phosphatase PAP2 family protein [Desulfarculus sp.]|jgi:membrane-associated phospholipid phosphatase|nr:MAG: phosphatase PAP2 family protein [Desulfarculus sp.]
MDRGLLKTTALAALSTAAAICLLYFFADRAVDLAAHTLKDSAWYAAGKSLSLLADHHLFNVLLFAGFVWAGGAALGRGLSPRVRGILYCCLAVAVAMIVGDFLKWCFGRFRPELLFTQGQYGFSFFADNYNQHSFPSGHTLRIFSAATALSLLWPRARLPLLTLAGLVGVSRVVVTKHFPSDVLAGAFVGLFCALWAWRIMRGDGVDKGQEINHEDG